MQKNASRQHSPSKAEDTESRSTCEIEISIAEQRLVVKSGDQSLRAYPISSSRFGLGTEHGSKKTPVGRFQIAEKIGHGVPHGTVFRARVPLSLQDSPPATEDLITSRILWLEGVEPHNANTKDRYIYIHGTRHEERIGQPDSHGCIRMRNTDIIELFDLVRQGTPVRIVD